MGEFFFVALGGAIGSGARYIVSVFVDRWLQRSFPFGTFAVNVLGSLLLGALIEYFIAHKSHHPGLRLALTTGLMGGFTTYSTFNYETLHLTGEGAYGVAALYVAATLVACLVGGAIGIQLGRLF
ncbi:MAG: fluoride efflux transporter CrcB [Deltaproteobacteria bacterium]|nr:fluoride efflux transporter CrcB [Deltaproteobacteria bacterium]